MTSKFTRLSKRIHRWASTEFLRHESGQSLDAQTRVRAVLGCADKSQGSPGQHRQESLHARTAQTRVTACPDCTDKSHYMPGLHKQESLHA